MKTLIELFDYCQLNNVAGVLKYRPERVVYVGFKRIMTKKRKRDIETFITANNMKVRIEYVRLPEYDLDSIVDILSDIVENNKECCIDALGGRELVLIAMGIVAGKYHIPLIQTNIMTGKMIKFRNADTLEDNSGNWDIALTVADLVKLNGGAVIKSEDQGWDFNEQFIDEVRRMWKVCSNNALLWNRQCNLFGVMDSHGTCDENGVYSVSLTEIKRRGFDIMHEREIIDGLCDEGLIRNFCIYGDYINYSYKNRHIRKCLLKAGNLLEMYVYITARDINKRYNGIYSDIRSGVTLDWDGVIHEDMKDYVETRNEVDIFIMKGMRPVLISCKNGSVNKEALYELDTVASRYGGDYSKKILVTSYIATSQKQSRYILARAADMGIRVISGVDSMSHDEFIEALYKVTR